MELNQVGSPLYQMLLSASFLCHCCSCCIYDIAENIDFVADDCVCHRETKDTEETVKLQRDMDRLGCWARTRHKNRWGRGEGPILDRVQHILFLPFTKKVAPPPTNNFRGGGG